MKTVLTAPAPRIMVPQPKRRAGWPTPDRLALSLLCFVVAIGTTVALLALAGLA